MRFSDSELSVEQELEEDIRQLLSLDPGDPRTAEQIEDRWPWLSSVRPEIVMSALEHANTPLRRRVLACQSFVPGRLTIDERVAIHNSRDIDGGDLTVVQWFAILEAYARSCAYCLSNNKQLEIEHIKPIWTGGRTTATNILPACVHCNRQKRGKSLTKWIGVASAEAILKKHLEIVCKI